MSFLSNLINKTVSHLGFTSYDSRRSEYSNNLLINNSFHHATSLSEYLYYRYYSIEDNIFFLDNSVAGFMLEIEPIVGGDISLSKNLDYFFNNELPHGSWIQFLLIASNDIEKIINEYLKTKGNSHPTLKKLTKNYVDFLRRAANNFSTYDGILARNFRIFISFSRFCDLQSASANRKLEEIKSFKKSLVKKLEINRLTPRICNDIDLINIVRELFEFSSKSLYVKQNKNNIFREEHATLDRRILSNNMRYELNNKSFNNLTTNISTKCYNLQDLPTEWSLQRMVHLLGAGLRENIGISARFCISYTLATNIGEVAQSEMQSRGNKVIHAAEQWYCRNNRNLQREAIEWKNINDRAKNGERFLSENFQVIISSPTEYIEEAEQTLLNLYRSYDWQLTTNDQFHLPAILSVLPMQQPLYWQTLNLHKQTKICMSSEITPKLPIHAEWKGVPESGMIFFGRRGQLFHWNPFYRIASGNYNVSVIGPSGGGKSVFLQALSSNMMAQNVRVFILDIGKSFAELGQLLGGEIIEFGRKVNFTLNPFAAFSPNMDKDEFNDLVRCTKELLLIMINVKDDRGEAELEKAIVRALSQSDYVLDIDEFASHLSNSESDILKEYGIILFSYTKNGIYGKYFIGEKVAKFKSHITIFEFEEIKKDRKLLAIILQILLIEINNQFFIGDRKQKFMIIVEEAWKLLDYSAGFFAEFGRTVRKYGGSLVTCVQNFQDLQKTDHHRTILENSTWTILLKQDEKGLHAFKESEAFKDILPLIRSISLSPGKYSEMLISSTGLNVIGRLVLDKYSKALYSTDNNDFYYLQKLQSEGISLDIALEMLAEKKYGEE